MASFNCPRCEGFIPSLARAGEYPGATSRADNETEICSACGADEALRIELSNELVPMHDWPIMNGAHEFATSAEVNP